MRKSSQQQTRVLLTNPSNTKRTLIQLLQKQTELLRVDIIQQSQDALIKQLAKRKVIYKLSRKNQFELVYAYIALSEYYVSMEYFEAALKSLHESLEIVQTGDACFLIGQIYFNQNKFEQSKSYLESALENQWIQPSNDHKIANRLECMTYLQKVYFSYGIQMKDKLLELSQKKINQTRKQNTLAIRRSENYFLALSMADLAIIHQAFQQYEIALQKISSAISVLETSNQDPEKLVDLYLLKASLHSKINQKKILQQGQINYGNGTKVQQRDVLMKVILSLFKGMNLIDRYQLSEEKVVLLLERLIKINIL